MSHEWPVRLVSFGSSFSFQLEKNVQETKK